MATPTPSTPSNNKLEGLPLLFSLIEDTKKISKVKAMLKADSSLASAREGVQEHGRNALCVACSSNNVEIVKLLVNTFDVDVSTIHAYPFSYFPWLLVL
jgi:hypothetical protein|tara:strand:- start:505 stop:801 length:297 start_codon:yes stop_codon:yes gene_type:complete